MAEKQTTEKQSTFKELVLPVIVLVVICLVCSALLAVLNDITAPIIAENTQAETLAAYVSVLPEGTTTDSMTAYVYPDMAVDALASATPLAVADKTTLPLLDVFLGFHGGMMGEVCVLAILLGFAYLVATRTIQATIPVTIVATVFVLTALNTGSAYTALIECMSGGLLFGAVFMATDYVTSPFTTKGKLFYGVFIGLITFLIRHFGSMNEGMSYAILLGNLMTPWFNAWGHQTPLGYKKPQKAAKGGKE